MSDQDTTPVLGEPAEANQAPAAEGTPDILASIVNADGVQKYSSTEEALKALLHSQEHIAKIEQDNASLKEQAARAKAAEDILEKLSAKSAPSAPPAAPVLDDARIAEVVQAQLTAKEKADLVKKNQAETKAALIAEYGEDKYAEVFKRKAQEIGVSVDFLNDVAAKSSKAALDLFGVKAPTANPLPNKLQSTVRVEGTKQPEAKTFKMNGSTQTDILNEWRRHKPQQ